MSVTILTGDAEAMLRTLPDQSVQCCVTSPPYFALRDYGTAQWDGGDPECDHKPPPRQPRSDRPDIHGFGTRSVLAAQDDGATSYRQTCGKCGATRDDKQIGLESTLAEYLDRLVGVFREVRRVLANDGVLWLNIGDSYFGTGKGPTPPTGFHKANGDTFYPKKVIYKHETLKGKDLMMVPARLALALQADGWYLRSDIIWAKPNPMPESVTDRPTSAHEHIFLLSKSARYFYDADAIRTPITSETTKMPDGWDTGPGGHGSFHRNGREKGEKTDKQRGHSRRHDGFNDRWDSMSKEDQQANGANARNVWTIATVGFPGAHFATFPPEIPRRCILAGTSEKGQCPACGKPWVRMTNVTYDNPGNRTTNGPRSLEQRHETAGFAQRLEKRVETTGWQPSCQCDAGDPVPQTVLDPFAGAGTTGLVADRLNRNAILIELHPAYVQMARDRIYNDAPMFAEVTA